MLRRRRQPLGVDAVELCRGCCVTGLLLLLLSSWKPSAALELGQCKAPLGMESGEIKDEDVSASSSFDKNSVGPQYARIRHDTKGGAWCPKPLIQKDVKEFLEINFGEMMVVTSVETQGRFGNGDGKEYAEHFMLEYWRSNLQDWVRFKNRQGDELFEGNINTYTEVKQEISPPIIASKLRFLPYSVHPRTVCMRVEVYGCPWKDGIMAYAMPQGERRGAEIDLFDMVYDGIEAESFLYGGLGQLTDGQKGQDNFRLDSNGLGKGYEWIGWKNDTGHTRPVEITFEFDQVRNFSAAYFYANNLFTKDVQVFSAARISFSVGGRYFGGDVLQFAYMPDTVVENARNVTVHLHGRVGRFVKFQLYFGSKWLLVSEVSFDSVVANGNFSEEIDLPTAPNGQLFPVDNRDDHGVSTAMNDEAVSTQYIGLVIGVLAAVILLLVLIIFVIIVRNRRRKQNNNHTVLKPLEKRVTINMKVALEEPDKLYYHEPYKPYQEPYKSVVGYTKRKLPDVPLTPDYTGSSTSREYAVPDLTSTLITTSPLVFGRNAAALVPPSPAERHYAATEICKVQNIQGVSGTTTYAVPNVDLLTHDDLSAVYGAHSICEFPRHRLRFLEKLGEGQFGEVHLCEAEGIPELVDVPTFGTSRLVAVKVLRPNAGEVARCDFHKEVRILAKLRDPNIVHVLGVCTRDEPLCMIVEYMENGDLNQYLQEHVAESLGGSLRPPPNDDKVLSYGSLIYMATQVASGMKYLESLNFVHRDLATRNCLVGSGYSIKIADFGMSRSLYAADYYKIEGRAVLPIRWMAWESILLGKFTTKSDVWSFAVTLWEILTLAREQPYEDMNDEKVIENVGHFYHNDGMCVFLSQPINCPKEIYDLMRECWQRNEAERPNFREIHLFLQRKNLGYQPEVL